MSVQSLMASERIGPMSPGGKLTFCAASWKEQHHSLEVQLHFYDLEDDNS